MKPFSPDTQRTSVEGLRSRIIAHLDEHDRATTSGIAHEVGRDYSAVRRQLLQLEAFGLVSRRPCAPGANGRRADLWSHT